MLTTLKSPIVRVPFFFLTVSLSNCLSVLIIAIYFSSTDELRYKKMLGDQQILFVIGGFYHLIEKIMKWCKRTMISNPLWMNFCHSWIRYCGCNCNWKLKLCSPLFSFFFIQLRPCESLSLFKKVRLSIIITFKGLKSVNMEFACVSYYYPL